MVAIKVMYGTAWCGDCKRAKSFLKNYNISYRYVDVDVNKAAFEEMKRVNGGRGNVPTIVFEDGSVLVEPSNKELATKLELSVWKKVKGAIKKFFEL